MGAGRPVCRVKRAWVAPKDGTVPFDARFVTVTAGDTLYLHVNQNVGTAHHTTDWVPAIAYR
jgi:hypothetical protein